MILEPHPLRIAENTIYGDKVLSILQDQSTPFVDLLVREAIQNSLDAALGDDAPVRVSFSLREFDPCELTSAICVLPTESDGLANKNRVLEIRDTGTTGLTGEVLLCNVKDTKQTGNFIKLVFCLGVNQTKEASGGSWGFGKTIFFRPGCGLVFYYSKLQSGESRLAACLVEDQNRNEGILKELDINTGVCWWGAKSKIVDGRKCLEPLTDEGNILEVLNLLNSKPFNPGESGTSIIIPFLSDKFIANCSDTKLKLSIMKWYGPRLYATWNQSRKTTKSGPRLIVSINDECINPNEEHFFSVLNVLHKYAVQDRIDGEDLPAVSDFMPRDAWRRDEIRYGKKLLGWLAWVELSGRDLKLANGFRSPDEILFLNEPSDPDDSETQQDFPTGDRVGGGRPLLLMTRSPGMIIQYSTDDDWVGNECANPDSWLVGMFVVNSADEKVEHYFRSCEYAVHNDWVHPSDLKPESQPVVNYVRHVQKKIRDIFTCRLKAKVETAIRHQAFSLSRQIARIFMPKDGFGTGALVDDNPVIPERSGGEGNRSRKTMVKDSTIEYLGDGVYVNLHIFIPAGKSFRLEVRVVGETGSMNVKEWLREYGVIKFPFELSAVEVSSVKALDEKGQSSINPQTELIKIDDNNVAFNVNIPPFWPAIKAVLGIILVTRSKEFSFSMEIAEA
jgi:hypothetical protein